MNENLCESILSLSVTSKILKKIRMIDGSVERNVEWLLSGKCPRYFQVLYRQFDKVLGFPTAILYY